MRCPKCGTNNPPEEQLTYCQSCGTELRVVCPRCSTDNPAFEEFCRECGLELHPNRAQERAAGIRKGKADPDGDEEPFLSRYAQFIVGGLVVAAVLWIPVVNTLRQRSQYNNCQSNLTKIVIALRQYGRDYDSVLPAAESWTPTLLPYLKDAGLLKCPARPEKVGYAFNTNLSGLRVILPPGRDVIAFFEAKGGGANLTGTDFEWLKEPAHSRGNNVALLSGAVKGLSKSPELGYWLPAGSSLPSSGIPSSTEPAPGATMPEGAAGGNGIPSSQTPTGVPVPDTTVNPALPSNSVSPGVP